MSQTEPPIVFEVIEIFRKYYRQILIVPPLVGAVVWVAALTIPPKFEHALLLHAGINQTAGAELSEAVELAEMKFKGERRVAGGSVALTEAKVTRTSDYGTSATLRLVGSSREALEAASKSVVDYLTETMTPRWRIRLEKTQESLNEVDQQIAASTTTLDEVRKQLSDSRELTKSLTFRLVFENLSKEIANLRRERRELTVKVAEAGKSPFNYSQSSADSKVLVFPQKNRLALAATLGALMLILVGGYLLMLTGRVARPDHSTA